MLRPAAAGLRRACGLSLVELMVGTTVGLLVMAGSMSMFVKQVGNSRQMLQETRLNQDLRAAADLIARDLRRAGYWGNAIQGTQSVGSNGAGRQNPYSAITVSDGVSLSYSFSRDTTENNILDDTERFGFRLRNGTVQMQSTADQWQDLTDNRSILVTGFIIGAVDTVLPLGHLCARTCAAGTANCPTNTLRSYTLRLTGRSLSDSTMVRSLESTVRLRNDRLAGQCPA